MTFKNWLETEELQSEIFGWGKGTLKAGDAQVLAYRRAKGDRLSPNELSQLQKFENSPSAQHPSWQRFMQKLAPKPKPTYAKPTIDNDVGLPSSSWVG